MAVDLYQVVLGGIAVAIMVLVPILSVVLYDLLGRTATAVAGTTKLSCRAQARGS